MLVLLGLLLVTPPRLANARLRAEFGPRGLVALTDAARHTVYRLTPDEFVITLGGALRFAGGRGLLAVVQNPFLEFRRDGNAFAIRYQPDMDWRAEYGPFASDRGMLAPVRLSGRTIPARMLPEWRLGPSDSTPGM